jgi:hypothetical protein
MRTSALLLVLLGCAQVDNPTGDCKAGSNGAHAGYSVPDRGDTYLPDCDAPLDRELWRVFAQPEGTAYIIPRPDASGLTYDLCDDAELGPVFERTGLCEPVADPAVVNALTPEDALTVTHALHERLTFVAVDNGDSWSLDPFAPPGDLADACDAGLEDEPGASGLCEEMKDRASGRDRTDIARLWGETETRLAADALNDLYGVTPR